MICPCALLIFDRPASYQSKPTAELNVNHPVELFELKDRYKHVLKTTYAGFTVVGTPTEPNLQASDVVVDLFPN